MKSFILGLVSLFLACEGFSLTSERTSSSKYVVPRGVLKGIIIERRNFGNPKKVKTRLSKKYSVQSADDGDYVHDFRGRLLNVNDFDKRLIYDGGPVDIGHRVTFVGLTGSTDFTMSNNTCIAAPVAPTPCGADISFVPTILGEQTATMHGYDEYQGQPPVPFTVPIRGVGVLTIDCPECEETRNGSIVDVDSHSFREMVDIVGTDISLYYSSKHTTEYKGLPYPNATRLLDYNPEGWSVSLVHRYDQTNQNLFLGTGVKVKRSSMPGSVSGQVYVVDGDNVYVFDSAGKHIQTKSYLTGMVKYSFAYTPTQGKISTITDSFGKVTTFSRNGIGELTSITSPYSQVTTIVPNSSGLIGEIIDPQLNSHVLTYYPGTELLQIFQKPNGHKTTFFYRPSGWLDYEISDGGNGWGSAPELTENGSDTSIIDALENTTVFEMRRDFTTGQYSRVSTAPSGLQTTYLESSDRSQSVVTPYKTTTTTTKNDERFGATNRRLFKTVETIQGLTRTSTYNRTASLSNSADPYSYTQIVNTTNINGSNWIDTFVKATKTLTSKTPLNVATITVFDAYERPTSVQLSGDTAKGFQYDTLGRLWKTTQGASHDTTYGYDANGNLASITNALNEITQFGYNPAGRKTSITYPDLRVSQISYNENGQVTGITPPGRPIHTFTFNLMETPETYLPPTLSGVPVVNTVKTYNLAKQLTKIERPDGRNLDFVYNTKNQLEQIYFTPTEFQYYEYYPDTDNPQYIETPQGVISEFTYFGDDKVLSELQQRGTETSKVTFTYDSLFRKKTRTTQFDSATASTITTTYRTDNQPSQVGSIVFNYDSTSGRVGTTTIGNIKDLRTYDTYGNIQNYSSTYQVGTSTPTNLYSYSLSRDNLHRIITKSETVQGVTTTYGYTYDNSGRLKTVTKNGLAHSNYNYDSNSNRISGTLNGTAFTGTYDDQDRMTAFTGFTYLQNANGEVTEIRNVSTNTATNLTTDSMGRITQFTTPTSVLVDYKLDWDGKRNVKLVNNSVQRRFIWEDAYRLAAEKIISPAQTKEYIYGTSANSPEYMKVGSTTYRILKDHLGSPRLVVRTSDGVVMQRLNYNEWGAVIEDSSPGFQPFGFAGGLYDQDSKLVHFGARDYDPGTGRWMSKDPIGFDGGDTNLYGYVLNDPVNFVDPSGLMVGAILRVAVPIAARIGAAVCMDNLTPDQKKKCAARHEAQKKVCESLYPGDAVGKATCYANSYINNIVNCK